MTMTQSDRIPTIEQVVFAGNETSAQLNINDGIQYGIGFFETMLVLDGPVFLHWHLERLNNSLETFDIPVCITEQLIMDIVEKYNIHNKVLKVQVDQDNVLAFTRELHYDLAYYERGVNLCLSPVIRSSKSLLVNHKSANYGDLILSLRDTKKKGYDDCVFFNEKGFVCETAVTNLFVIKDNKLFTPNVSAGILPGIVRRFIIETYDVVETNLSLDDLAFADGIFLTNSLVGLVKVNSIDFDKKLIAKARLIQMEDFIVDRGEYEEHPLFKKIRDDYLTTIKS